MSRFKLLCEHQCWTPDCKSGRHCPEEADESHLKSPTDFFTERGILESDGNNLVDLEIAVGLLAEALVLTNELATFTGDTGQVANVHIYLARLHLLIAEHKCRPLMNSDPLLQITPEVLVANDCHTIQQVQDFLELNGKLNPTFFLADEFSLSFNLQVKTESTDTIVASFLCESYRYVERFVNTNATT